VISFRERTYDEASPSRTTTLTNCSELSCAHSSEDVYTVAAAAELARTGDFGRRIYIHELSFEYFANRGTLETELAYAGLISIPALKLVHHLIVGDAVALGQFRANLASLLYSRLRDEWSNCVTTGLSKLAYRPSDPKTRHLLLPVLSEGEVIEATCYDARYFTFATSHDAAKRMYSDVRKLRDVRHLLHIKDDAYKDLTLIRGDSLCFLSDLELASPTVQKNEPTTAPLGSADCDAKERLFEAYCKKLEAVFQGTLRNPLPNEQMWLDKVYEQSAVASRMLMLGKSRLATMA
jgi:hypothetical protein